MLIRDAIPRIIFSPFLDPAGGLAPGVTELALPSCNILVGRYISILIFRFFFESSTPYSHVFSNVSMASMVLVSKIGLQTENVDILRRL